MNSSTSTTSARGGVGFAGLLTIVFIVLKLTGIIAWSWWWVLAPLWISAAIGVLVFAVVVLVALILARR